MSLDRGRDVWETTVPARTEQGLSAKAVTASVIVKTTTIILACVSSFVTVVHTNQYNQMHKSRTDHNHEHTTKCVLSNKT